jgi:hypothetical protein
MSASFMMMHMTFKFIKITSKLVILCNGYFRREVTHTYECIHVIKNSTQQWQQSTYMSLFIYLIRKYDQNWTERGKKASFIYNN